MCDKYNMNCTINNNGIKASISSINIWLRKKTEPCYQIKTFNA